MLTLNDLSSYPPAVLRAALEESEKRIQPEKDKLEKEIRQRKKRLDELEKGVVAREQEPERSTASGPSKARGLGKRKRVVSDSSDDESRR
jgi:hypothetical protein